MNKSQIKICLTIILALTSCSVSQPQTQGAGGMATAANPTKTKFLTYKGPGISFSAFEVDYDPNIWVERQVEKSTFRYLESVQLPRCVFHDLLGSGNGPYGEEFHFTLDEREFAYYLNTPNEYPGEKTRQSILIYYRDPDQDLSVRWGFQVFSDYQTVDQCLDLVKELLSNLRNE